MKNRQLTILLVEDNPDHAEMIRRTLEAGGATQRLLHVPDGQAAVDYLSREAPYNDSEAYPLPDLLLLDLKLPKLSGLEVLEWMKTRPKLRGIATVILTTSSAEADMTMAYKLGAISYLVKPFAIEEFARLLDACSQYWLSWNRFPELID
ncbi:MAG: response regulator [Spirochaetia bacterium]|nr:response regulator [Spirochaetia bacterium]